MTNGGAERADRFRSWWMRCSRCQALPRQPGWCWCWAQYSPPTCASTHRCSQHLREPYGTNMCLLLGAPLCWRMLELGLTLLQTLPGALILALMVEQQHLAVHGLGPRLGFGPGPPSAGEMCQAGVHTTKWMHLSVTWLIGANLHLQMRLIKMELPFHL